MAAVLPIARLELTALKIHAASREPHSLVVPFPLVPPQTCVGWPCVHSKTVLKLRITLHL